MKNVILLIWVCLFASCTKTIEAAKETYTEGMLTINYATIQTVTPPLRYKAVTLVNGRLKFDSVDNCFMANESTSDFYGNNIISFVVKSAVLKTCE